MKTKVKVFSLIGLLLCLLMAFACLFSACGHGDDADPVNGTTTDDEEEEQQTPARDYSTYTYSDYAAIPQSEWDAKTIKYQLYTGDAGNIVLLYNLYEDGTFASWEVGMYTTDPDAMPDAAWVDEDRHIMWDFYGLWEQEDDVVTIYFVCSKSGDAVVEKSLDFHNYTKYTFVLPITNYQIKPNMDNLQDINNLLYLGVNTQAQIWPMGGSIGGGDLGMTYTLDSGDDIRFASFAEFYESYEDDFFPPL